MYCSIHKKCSFSIKPTKSNRLCLIFLIKSFNTASFSFFSCSEYSFKKQACQSCFVSGYGSCVSQTWITYSSKYFIIVSLFMSSSDISAFFQSVTALLFVSDSHPFQFIFSLSHSNLHCIKKPRNCFISRFFRLYRFNK